MFQCWSNPTGAIDFCLRDISWTQAQESPHLVQYSCKVRKVRGTETSDWVGVYCLRADRDVHVGPVTRKVIPVVAPSAPTEVPINKTVFWMHQGFKSAALACEHLIPGCQVTLNGRNQDRVKCVVDPRVGLFRDSWDKHVAPFFIRDAAELCFEGCVDLMHLCLSFLGASVTVMGETAEVMVITARSKFAGSIPCMEGFEKTELFHLVDQMRCVGWDTHNPTFTMTSRDVWHSTGRIRKVAKTVRKTGAVAKRTHSQANAGAEDVVRSLIRKYNPE
jgi:hypothetical protein